MGQAQFVVEARDIAALQDSFGLIHFFTRLGYATDFERNAELSRALFKRLHPRAVLQHQSAEITLTHLARQQDRNATLDIYLYELPRVTATLRNEIVRDLKQLLENCLLILTERGFHQLEFVYLDRQASGQEPLQPGLVDDLLALAPPLVRVKTVDRRHPSHAMVTLLRDFSLKTPDVLAQCIYLSKAFDAAETRNTYFNNRALFSNYYLQDRLPETDEWRDEEQPPRAALLGRAYDELRGLYYSGASEQYAELSKAQLRAHLFDPVLQTLGFSTRKPPAKARYDYLFTIPQEDGSETTIVCLVYRWGRLLDDPLTFLAPEEAARDEQPEENPAVTLVAQLKETGAQWGILSNGTCWRLYSARAQSRSTNYYEINLEDNFALARKQASEAMLAFRYFWLFFRRAAFVLRPAPVNAAPLSFLDSVLRGSQLYARALSESLKERVFDSIFPRFAQGFVEYALANGQLRADLLSLPEEERNRELQPYFAGTLDFLFRLLFLLYAESRELLPVHDERYREQSLQTLKGEIARNAGAYEGEPREKGIEEHYDALTGPDDCQLYQRLWKLFVAIDRGAPDLNVPAYHGDIFLTEPPAHIPFAQMNEDEQIAFFLKTRRIPDRYLAFGLDLLARDVDLEKQGTTARDAGKLFTIDYRSLGVRQLGSIYEGLLEFKLRVAVEPMAVVENRVVPANGHPSPIYARGDVYIENDLHERKATGSYYTPDYIVKYIIAETVGPILQQRLDREHNAVLRTNLLKYQSRIQQEKSNRRGKGELDEATYQRIAEACQPFVEAFFNLKVLDPSMGSGHFLVDAVDYITDVMVERLLAWQPTPLDVNLRNVRAAIQAEAEAQKVSIDTSLLSQINLLKRQVLKRCIFGVDLNPMAVRLAKLSLWIDSLTQGAPFSFLNHHLRCGNSLLGTTLHFIGQATQDLWGHELDVILSSARGYQLVSRNADENARALAESRARYAESSALLRPLRQISDLWLSEAYGNEGARQAISFHREAIFAGNVAPTARVSVKDSAKPRRLTFGETREKQVSVLDLLARAQALAAREGGLAFFHWDLEFPEAFFDDNGPRSPDTRGFDAIIGNPPYVRQEGLGADKDAFAALYRPVFSSIADLYTYFVARSHELLRAGARFGMITSNKFMRANYGNGLRAFLTDQAHLEKLVNFGELRVFADAATDPVIIISSKAQSTASVTYLQVKAADFHVPNFDYEDLITLVQTQGISIAHDRLGSSGWSLSDNEMQAVLDKLKNFKFVVPLNVYTKQAIRRGVITGYSNAFIIDEATREKLISRDQRSAEIIQPVLVGDDVRRYFLNWKNHFLIWTYVGIPIDNYPAIYEYLSQYKEQLEKRWDKGKHWWELRPCDYYSDFAKPKIIYPDISMGSRFVLDRAGYFLTNTAYTLPGDDSYLLALLNSRLLWLYLSKVCAVLGDAEDGGRLRIFTVYIESLPIRRIQSTTPEGERKALGEQSEQIYRRYLETGQQGEMLSFIEQLLAREVEAADVVRDTLAMLAEAMLSLNVRRQTAEGAFLGFIENAFHVQPQPDPKSGKVGLAALSNKTTLFEFAGDYLKGTPLRPLDEIVDVLKKNRKRCQVFADRFDLALHDLPAAYSQARADLDPLKQHLRWTDDLIDQIVYRLYGLSEEEMRLVDGSR